MEVDIVDFRMDRIRFRWVRSVDLHPRHFLPLPSDRLVVLNATTTLPTLLHLSFSLYVGSSLPFLLSTSLQSSYRSFDLEDALEQQARPHVS